MAAFGVSAVADVTGGRAHAAYRPPRGRCGDAECALLGDLAEVITLALRASLASTFANDIPIVALGNGPAVLLLTDDLQVLTQTSATESYLRTLLPTDADRRAVPAGAYNVPSSSLSKPGSIFIRRGRGCICARVCGRRWARIGWRVRRTLARWRSP